MKPWWRSRTFTKDRKFPRVACENLVDEGSLVDLYGLVVTLVPLQLLSAMAYLPRLHDAPGHFGGTPFSHNFLPNPAER